jgi:hypothetical protein
MPDTDSNRHVRPLEERLRASFAVGDASEQTTPNASKVPTPGEIEPASIALPLSPELEPTSSLDEVFDPLGVQLSPTPSQRFCSSPPTVSEMEHLSVEASLRDLTTNTNTSEVTSSPPPSESTAPPPSDSPLQIPSPPTPPPHLPDSMNAPDTPGVASAETALDEVALAEPVPKALLAGLSSPHADLRLSTPRPLSPLGMEDKEYDVEKLRERLKLVEQRFSGEFPSLVFVLFVSNMDQMFLPPSSVCKPKSVQQIRF